MFADSKQLVVLGNPISPTWCPGLDLACVCSHCKISNWI